MIETNGATALARRYFEAWNSHDAAAIVAVFTDDSTFWDNSMEHPQSIGEARAGFESFLSAVPDLLFVVKTITETVDGGAVAEWRMTGTKPDDNGTFDIPGVDVFEILDGRLRAARAYLNPAM